MSTFLKTFIFITALIPLGFANTNVYAQCPIVQTVKNNITIAETPEKYEYLRTDKQYYGLSIKTVLVKKAPVNNYTIVIKYTGGALSAQPAKLNFILKDHYILTASLKFVKSQKVDNSKVSTKIYEIALPGSELSRLKQTPLKEIQVVLNKNSSPVIIPVDDETFIQNQMSCLQNLELN